MGSIEVDDLVTRHQGMVRGAAPSVLAAALERTLLENMLSLAFTAQSRMMRNGPSTAAKGWSGAEDGALRMGRALNLVSQSIARLVRVYNPEANFAIDRGFADTGQNRRIDSLAMQALVSTDPDSKVAALNERAESAAFREALSEMMEHNRSEERDYLDQTLERLHRYEPEWATLQQFRAARRAGEEAAAHPPEPLPPEPPDELREAAQADAEQRSQAARDHMARLRAASEDAASALPSKSAKQVVDVPEAPPTKSGVAAHRRRRGAQNGNGHALKNGRHTAEAKSDRAADRMMMESLRSLGERAKQLAALGARLKAAEASNPTGDPAAPS